MKQHDSKKTSDAGTMDSVTNQPGAHWTKILRSSNLPQDSKLSVVSAVVPGRHDVFRGHGRGTYLPTWEKKEKQGVEDVILPAKIGKIRQLPRPAATYSKSWWMVSVGEALRRSIFRRKVSRERDCFSIYV
jgi:hypothetical protein